jgi:hypothetical protein
MRMMKAPGRLELTDSNEIHPEMKILYASDYTKDIAPHGVIEENLSCTAKSYSLHDLAKKIRKALDGKL